MTNQPGLQLPEGIQRFVAVVDDCRDDGGDLGVSLVQAHAGDLIRVEDIPALLDHFKERLGAVADALERQTLDGDGGADLTAATVRAVKAQGIRDALATAFQDNTDSKEAPDGR